MSKETTHFHAIGPSIWLTALMLASTGGLALTNLVMAQQDSSESTLARSTLSAEVGESGVVLSWTNVEGAVRYQLWAWTSAVGWWAIGGDSLTSTTFTHTDVTDGTTYFYSVRAVNAQGETSDWSAYVSATAGSYAPSTPALTAEVEEAAIVLSWGAVEGALRYELWAWTRAAGWWEIGGDSLTGTTYRHTDVTVGTTYFYSIRAVNNHGETSGWSEYVSATATLATIPEGSATATPTITSTTDPGATATATSTVTITPVPGATPTATATPTITPTPPAGATATATSTPTSSARDRAALVAFYNATDGANWTNNDNWLSQEPLGTWYGVSTDESGRVEALTFYNNGLSGSVPSMSSLTKLIKLDLQNNQLTGTIPSLSSLTNLWWLNLSQNQLNGSIPSLSSLTNLEYLYLRENKLSGSIPSLSSLTKLKVISLHKNMLSGSIPSLGTKHNLSVLNLNDNKLSGSIPNLTSLTRLGNLHLQNNNLSGSISNLRLPTSLQEVRLDNNKLTGSIVDLSSNSLLTRLYLNDNMLTGTIPNWLGDARVLSHLYLADNRLSGCIPESLRSLSNSDLGSLGLPYCSNATTTPTPTPTHTTTATPTTTPTATPTPTPTPTPG